jgi:hypothetical protein
MAYQKYSQHIRFNKQLTITMLGSVNESNLE